MNIQNVRQIAAAFPGAEEGVCHGTMAFYVRRKLMLRLQDDGETLSIAFPKTERDELINRRPDVFSVTRHFQNYDAVLLSLPAASEELLSQMIEGAWRRQAGKKQILAYDLARLELAESIRLS